MYTKTNCQRVIAYLLSVFMFSSVYSQSFKTFKDSLLSEKGIYFGTGISVPDINEVSPRPEGFLDSLAMYFNFITIQAGWNATEPSNGVFTWNQVDKMADYAVAHNMKAKVHSLVWWVPDHTPDWLEYNQFSGDSLNAILKRHIDSVVTHFKTKYPGLVTEYVVVNEPVCSANNSDYPCAVDGMTRDIFWTKVHKLNSTDPSDYVQLALEYADEADANVRGPKAKMFINQNSFELYNSQYFDNFYNFCSHLKEMKEPLDGVSIEGHINGAYNITAEQIYQNLKKYKDLRLLTNVSENDIVISKDQSWPPVPLDVYPPDSLSLAIQARKFRTLFSAILSLNNSTSYVLWNPWDSTNEQNEKYLNPDGSFVQPLYAGIIGSDWRPKPALRAMIAELKHNDRKVPLAYPAYLFASARGRGDVDKLGYRLESDSISIDFTFSEAGVYRISFVAAGKNSEVQVRVNGQDVSSHIKIDSDDFDKYDVYSKIDAGEQKVTLVLTNDIPFTISSITIRYAPVMGLKADQKTCAMCLARELYESHEMQDSNNHLSLISSSSFHQPFR